MSHLQEAAGVILGFDGRGAPGGTDIDHAIQVALESQAFVGPISIRLDTLCHVFTMGGPVCLLDPKT